MQNNDLISVIVPIYNTEKYLRRCIESILNQTYRNFEIILVNDGSTDTSGKICEEYVRKYECIRVIHQKNQGQAAARNNAIKQIKGEWVHFVDSDDMIHPQMLEILLKGVRKAGANISVCDSVVDKQIPIDFMENQLERITDILIDEETFQEIFYARNNYYWTVTAKLIKKEIVQKIMFSEGKIYEDNAVVCRWLYEAKKIAICNNELYYYCIEEASTVRGEIDIRKIDYLWALKEQILFYKSINYLKMYAVVLKEFFLYAHFLLGKFNDNHIVERNKIRRNVFSLGINNGMLLYWSKEYKKIYFEICFPKCFGKIKKIKRIFK